MLTKRSTDLRTGASMVLSHARAFGYDANLRRRGISRSDLLVLATVTKAGTHYARFALANYARLATDRRAPAVQGGEINALLPNAWHKAYLRNERYGAPMAGLPPP